MLGLLLPCPLGPALTQTPGKRSIKRKRRLRSPLGQSDGKFVLGGGRPRGFPAARRLASHAGHGCNFIPELSLGNTAIPGGFPQLVSPTPGPVPWGSPSQPSGPSGPCFCLQSYLSKLSLLTKAPSWLFRLAFV